VKAIPGCDVYPTLKAALQSCRSDEDVYIIGGASVYQQALPLADRLCLTEIDDTPEQADTFFPDYSQWRVDKKEAHPKDERHAFNYAFVDYVK
jgi:dihydrofolate reductase